MSSWFRALAAGFVVIAGGILTDPASLAQELKAKKTVPLMGRTPAELPKIPPPDVKAAQVPAGFRVEVLLDNLTYPSSIEFDDQGNLYLAEAGFAYGDEAARARVSRVRLTPRGTAVEVVADQLSGPINDILWHNGRLYISHRGKISVLERDKQVRDLVTGLPSLGDHHNNCMAVGPDGKIYFGQGTATNSGVVGLDNFTFGWLQKYPDVHDIPARDIRLRAEAFTDPDPIALLTNKEFQRVTTAAFAPFGRTGDVGSGIRQVGASADEGTRLVKGQVKANGTILRMDADGSNLEVYAWGLRNPFGLGFTPDGKLLVTDAGYDERGSRPIANAPDCLWQMKQGAWYGFPDFAAGLPVTDPRFKSPRGPAPKFLLAEHPPVEKPFATLPPHTGGTQFDLSRHREFGKDQVYIALMGDMLPETGQPSPHPGFCVARMDLKTRKLLTFFRTHPDHLGPKGFVYAATSGPKRPIDVKFSPDGGTLYVVDFGAYVTVPTVLGPAPRPFPGTGAVWRITLTP